MNIVEIKISENVLRSTAVDIFRVSIFTLRLFNSPLICSIKSLIVSGEEKMSDEKCSQDDRIVNFPAKINKGITFLGELQGWRSGKSTHPPLMWTGLDSQC